MNYKVGDKVRVRQDLVVDEECAGWTFNTNMSSCKTITIERVFNTHYSVKESFCGWTDEMLEPLHRELKDIQYGDVITDGEAFIYILDRHNEVVIRSQADFTIEETKNADYSRAYSLKEFIEEFKNWKIVGQEDEETVEMTLEEIAELKGIDVKRLKIKK